MGVMGCNRNGCESIMCDRYNSNFGYICGDCFAELLTVEPSAMPVAEFMNTEKPEEVNTEANEAYYNALFERR